MGIWVLKDWRTVGPDNAVLSKGHRLQVHPSHHRTSYARTRVKVHERMNGSLAI